MIVPAASIERTRTVVAFTSVLAASVVLFTAYVAVKGAYQAATFEARVEERNLVYLTPLLFVALALFAATRAIRVWTLALAAALTAWSIQSLPLHLNGLEGDAPGLAILSRIANDHELDGRPDAPAALLARRRLRPRRAHAAPLAPPEVRVLDRRRSRGALDRLVDVGRDGCREVLERLLRSLLHGLPKPLGWVDEATGGKPAVYIGQKIADPNAIWSMEFWNRDVRKVWSLDGTAPGPGPILTPEPARDGRPPRRRSRLRVRRHRQRTSHSRARPCGTRG